jgi:thiosulfate/3-mercaptopyruvate sulfurtransferase
VHLGDPDWAIVDSRFTLADPGAGRRDYLEGHIPGAVYAHLDKDLCGPIIPGETGRHPLPANPDFVQTLSDWGIDSAVQVVAYDGVGGGMAAARLWWMCRWLGHEAVCVLNGGWQAWKGGGYPVRSGQETRPARTFLTDLQPTLLARTEDVESIRLDPDLLLVDCRAADRYHGLNETIDPIAGHIPGAVSAPYLENLDSEGKFLPPGELRFRLRTLLGNIPSRKAVFYCGSGVTAALSVLAVAYAGLGDAKLYSGSWSEWITDPDHPVSTGD